MVVKKACSITVEGTRGRGRLHRRLIDVVRGLIMTWNTSDKDGEGIIWKWMQWMHFGCGCGLMETISLKKST